MITKTTLPRKPKDLTGLSFTACFGRYAGFYVQFSSMYFRMCFGWFAFMVWFVDVEAFIQLLRHEKQNLLIQKGVMTDDRPGNADYIPVYYMNTFICTVENHQGAKLIFPYVDTKNRLRERVFLRTTKYGREAYVYENTTTRRKNNH